MEVNTVAEVDYSPEIINSNISLSFLNIILVDLINELKKLSKKVEVGIFLPQPSIQFGFNINIGNLNDYQDNNTPTNLILRVQTLSSKTDGSNGLKDTLTLLAILISTIDRIKQRRGFKYSISTSFTNYNESVSTVNIVRSFQG